MKLHKLRPYKPNLPLLWGYLLRGRGNNKGDMKEVGGLLSTTPKFHRN